MTDVAVKTTFAVGGNISKLIVAHPENALIKNLLKLIAEK
jgi:hypothetical protein